MQPYMKPEQVWGWDVYDYRGRHRTTGHERLNRALKKQQRQALKQETRRELRDHEGTRR